MELPLMAQSGHSMSNGIIASSALLSEIALSVGFSNQAHLSKLRRPASGQSSIQLEARP
jgi:transcriptional regulator GlxA family with amidase domain